MLAGIWGAGEGGWWYYQRSQKEKRNLSLFFIPCPLLAIVVKTLSAAVRNGMRVF